MGPVFECPYPTCGHDRELVHGVTCVCEYRQPLVSCARCGRPNRAGARFCRACRGKLSGPEILEGATLKAGAVGALSMTGSFRRPPIVANGFLYALSKSGVLFQLSSRDGAKARQVARFDLPSAGFNRWALVDIAAAEGSKDGGLRGWTFLAAGPSGIEGMSLADGKKVLVYEASSSEEVVANRSEADATAFKGVAADAGVVAFVVRGTSGENRLTIQYLAEDRPREQPVALEGSQVAGPALCGQRLVFCTEKQVGLYDRETRQAFVAELPREFAPLMSPSSHDLAIPPGGMPFVIEPASSVGEPVVHVAGLLRERAGLLRVTFGQREGRQTEEARGEAAFRELPRGSSLSTNRDGSACLSVLNAVEVYGSAKVKITQTRTQRGMPASFDSPFLSSFGEVDLAGQHRVQVMKDGQRVELRFEDDLCTRESCCGVYVVGGDVVVAYLDVDAGEGGEGLRFARWSLEL